MLASIKRYFLTKIPEFKQEKINGNENLDITFKSGGFFVVVVFGWYWGLNVGPHAC
jgi:hypothetical protein